MLKILVNYNYTPAWVDDECIVYDRSDDGEERKLPGKVIKTINKGNVDYDKLGFLVENYENLPEVFLWGKTNLFKYITKEEYRSLDKTTFQPLLTQTHKTREGISWYENGMYHEKTSIHTYGSWTGEKTWQEWASFFHLPIEDSIPFAPGGNYILTKERVHRHPKILYELMRSTLPYTTLPGEAHLCERSYFYLWR